MIRRMTSVLRCAMAIALPLTYASSALAFDLTILIDASLHERQAGPHVLGVRDGANSGVDPYDRPEPPSPPADFLRLAFTMPQYEGPLANAWREEYREPEALSVDQSEIWYVVVSTDVAPGDLVLACDVVDGWGIDFSLRYLGPPYGELEMTVPGTLTVPLSGPGIEFCLEITSEGIVDAAAVTWGGVKALYR